MISIHVDDDDDCQNICKQNTFLQNMSIAVFSALQMAIIYRMRGHCNQKFDKCRLIIKINLMECCFIRSVKTPKAESERSDSSSLVKVGKVKDANPKSLRKLSREEFEKRSKEDEKPSLLQSQSNPNLMTGLRKTGELKAQKAGEVKIQKAASDDMNRESRSRPGNKTPSSLKHAKSE